LRQSVRFASAICSPFSMSMDGDPIPESARSTSAMNNRISRDPGVGGRRDSIRRPSDYESHGLTRQRAVSGVRPGRSWLPAPPSWS